MVDLQTVEIELQNARQARINAELACCDIEELAQLYQLARRNSNFRGCRRENASPINGA